MKNTKITITLGVTGNVEFQETRIEEINGVKYQIIKSKI